MANRFIERRGMKKYIQWLSMFTLLIMLTGCDQKLSYEYLLQHPSVTRDEASKCMDSKYQTPEKNNQCKIVMAAVSKLMIVISEQQQDPEAFGQKIMDLEDKYAAAKAALAAAEQEIKQTQNGDKTKAQENLQLAKKTYEDFYNELQMLLAVAGLNSPE